MSPEVKNEAYINDNLESAYHLLDDDTPLEPCAILAAIASCYIVVAVFIFAS